MDPPAPTVPRHLRVRAQGSLFEAARRELGRALIGSVLPFALVFYLGLRGGGYDTVVYGEVGVAISWLLLLGAAVGIIPAARVPRAGWIALGLLAAFAAWTALGTTWSESAERSAAEAGRVATYLCVFALALVAQGREGRRRTLNAVGAAIGIVGILALLSRLQPEWFPANDAARLLPGELGNRLGYPLDYWNGLAALMAMGIPLLLVAALRARHLVTQAFATAALPALALTAFYTFSRGGVIAIGLAILAFLGLYPQRLTALPTLLVSGAGTALLVIAGAQRNALEDRVLTDAALAQGDEMLAMVLVVCAGVGLLRVAIGLAGRHGLGPRPRVGARHETAFAVGALAVAIAIALAAGVPGELADRWDGDTSVASSAGPERFESVNADSRQYYWESALKANATAPLIGIGPGTFEFWWARNGDPVGGFIRDAHSLFVETLAELGIIGFVLVVAFLGTVLGAGIRRARAAGPESRATLAAALACCLAFIVTAAVDWVWELAVLPVAFVLVAASILAAAPEEGSLVQHLSRRGRLGARVALVTLAALSLIAIAIPLASTELVRQSQTQLRSGERDSALRYADAAGTVQPFAATPSAQRAEILERSGELAAAVEASRQATRDEPTNWRTWLLLANLEAELGRPAEASDAYNRAYELNGRSQVFRETSPVEFESALAE